jgi:hypothetical protein
MASQDHARGLSMTLYRAYVHFFWLLTVLTGLSVYAQSPNYHLEFSDGPMKLPKDYPRTRWVSLVNDSSKQIEAYDSLELSPDGGFCAETSEDFLTYPYPAPMANVFGADGKESRGRGVEQGGRWDLGYLGIDRHGKECELKAVAVVFVDGSYEGDEVMVRGLKAHRDGVAAALNYWSQEMVGKEPNKANLADLVDHTENRSGKDDMEKMKYLHSMTDDEAEKPLREYWSGRYEVDQFLKYQLSSEPTDDAGAARKFQQLMRLLNTWKTLIDTAVSMNELNLKYPPISDSREPSDHTSKQ